MYLSDRPQEIVQPKQAVPVQQPKPEHLSKQQLNALIANAKTSAEHQRIAQFYEAKAQDDRDQVREHEAMVAAYRGEVESVQREEPGKRNRPLRIPRPNVQGSRYQVAGACSTAQTDGQGFNAALRQNARTCRAWCETFSRSGITSPIRLTPVLHCRERRRNRA